MLAMLLGCSLPPLAPAPGPDWNKGLSPPAGTDIDEDALRLLTEALERGMLLSSQGLGEAVSTGLGSPGKAMAAPASEGVRLPAESSVNSPASKSLQPKLLKQINSLTSKEEILGYVEHCHHLLDSINLVTCLYRLARIYSFTQAAEQKATWMTELLDSQSFSLLLSVIHNHLTQAQAILCTQAEVPGLNARCISNLVWSIVKLEMTAEDGHQVSAMAVDVVITAAPLVMRFIPDCSGQGLSNLLWSFAKIPTSPPSVMTAIVARMVQLLEQPVSSNILDAQALSNSIWAIAHVRSRPNDLDNQQEWQNVVTNFLLLVANQCLHVLSSPTEANNAMQQQPHRPQAAYSNEPSDGRFSCQAVVNIAWSFSTILGSACGVQDPIRPLFMLIRQLTVARLQAILTGGSAGQPWTHALTGSFNEQALSNVVYAFDKAQLLSTDLLQAVFDMASLRLGRASAGSQGPLGFKPQELCTLLRACHLGIAQPWSFLHSLSRLMAQYPSATAAWTPAEMMDLHRALQLLRNGVPAQLQALMNPRPRPQFITPPSNYGAAAQLLGGTSSTSSPRAMQQQQMSLGPHPLTRHVSAPQPALVSVLQEMAAGMNPGMNGNVFHSNPYLGMSPNMPGMPGQQGGPSLQQVWVVDAAGNLQPTTLLLHGGAAAGMQQLPQGYEAPGYPTGYMQ